MENLIFVIIFVCKAHLNLSFTLQPDIWRKLQPILILSLYTVLFGIRFFGSKIFGSKFREISLIHSKRTCLVGSSNSGSLGFLVFLMNGNKAHLFPFEFWSERILEYQVEEKMVWYPAQPNLNS